MKQGSTDDPFAEDPEPADDDVTESPQPDAAQETTDPSGSATQSQTSESTADESGDASYSRTLPYIYKRDAVKEHRSQRPVYLREYNEERIADLKTAVEGNLGEEVTKTDILEAAMETAIENPELVAETLRTERYGYDWE